MRSLIVYILVPCLFLLKGHYSATPVAGQHVQATPAKAAFRELKNTDDQQQYSVLAEEDNDDEFSYAKKKTAQASGSLLQTGSLPAAVYTATIKTTNRFYKHFSYLSSDKYIFHREIMI